MPNEKTQEILEHPNPRPDLIITRNRGIHETSSDTFYDSLPLLLREAQRFLAEQRQFDRSAPLIQIRQQILRSNDLKTQLIAQVHLLQEKPDKESQNLIPQLNSTILDLSGEIRKLTQPYKRSDEYENTLIDIGIERDRLHQEIDLFEQEIKEGWASTRDAWNYYHQAQPRLEQLQTKLETFKQKERSFHSGIPLDKTDLTQQVIEQIARNDARRARLLLISIQNRVRILCSRKLEDLVNDFSTDLPYKEGEFAELAIFISSLGETQKLQFLKDTYHSLKERIDKLTPKGVVLRRTSYRDVGREEYFDLEEAQTICQRIEQLTQQLSHFFTTSFSTVEQRYLQQSVTNIVTAIQQTEATVLQETKEIENYHEELKQIQNKIEELDLSLPRITTERPPVTWETLKEGLANFLVIEERRLQLAQNKPKPEFLSLTKDLQLQNLNNSIAESASRLIYRLDTLLDELRTNLDESTSPTIRPNRDDITSIQIKLSYLTRTLIYKDTRDKIFGYIQDMIKIIAGDSGIEEKLA